MFGLLSRLAEILAPYGQWFFDGRRGARDVDVAERLLGAVLALEDLIGRGERILALAERLPAGTAGADQDAEFEELPARQVDSLQELRTVLTESHALLLTIDADLYRSRTRPPESTGSRVRLSAPPMPCDRAARRPGCRTLRPARR